jgi:hypothetical protein
MNGQIGGY